MAPRIRRIARRARWPRGDTQPVGLGWHPAKPLLATASDDGSVRLWDIASRRHEVLCELGVGVTGVAWSPDGTRLAVSDKTGRIGIWIRSSAGHCTKRSATRTP